MTYNITRMALDAGAVEYIAEKITLAIIANDKEHLEEYVFDLKIKADNLYRETQEISE